MSDRLERLLGFSPRADVLLRKEDGTARLWIEFEVSRADPVANHAKFATSHLFEPRSREEAFVSMVSPHVSRGRSNLAASAVYLMRAVGMSAFQTALLPTLPPEVISRLNHVPLDALLGDPQLGIKDEIDRAVQVARSVGLVSDHLIHYAANLFEVMANARRWNEEICIEGSRLRWGKRTSVYFVFDPHQGLFAPSKFCAFVPVSALKVAPAAEISVGDANSMSINLYANLDESETRFDGNLAQRHMTRRLSLGAVPLEHCDSRVIRQFDEWTKRNSDVLVVHRRGATILMPPAWW